MIDLLYRRTNEKDRHEVWNCKTQFAMQPQIAEALGITSGTIGSLNSGRANTAKTTGQIRNLIRGSEADGTFPEKNPPDSHSRSCRYCQKRVVVIPWQVRITGAPGRHSWVSLGVTGDVRIRHYNQVESTTGTILAKSMYKVAAELDINVQQLEPDTCLFDTASGLNPVSKAFLNRKWLPNIMKHQLLRLRTAIEEWNLGRWYHLVIYTSLWLKCFSIIRNSETLVLDVLLATPCMAWYIRIIFQREGNVSS